MALNSRIYNGEIKPLYSGKPGDFHWAAFGSGTGTNLEELAKIQPPSIVFSDNPGAGLFSQPHLKNMPVVVYDARILVGKKPKRETDPFQYIQWEKKADRFDNKVAKALTEFEEKEGYRLDLIVLGGYMRIVRDPLILAYRDRIINVHPGDLSVLTADNKRKYVGAKAVYNAIVSGERRTRSSVIIVDGGVDHGEILTQGPWMPVTLEMDDLDRENIMEYVKDHQQRQKEISDFPAMKSAFIGIREGKFGLSTRRVMMDEWRRVYLDENPLPYGGYEVMPH